MSFQTLNQNNFCPVESSLELLSGRWKGRILWKLQRSSALRFGELKIQLVGITEKVLTEQLRELEREKLISRKVYQEFPPKVEYSLTEFGKSLAPVFDILANWGASNKTEIFQAVGALSVSKN